MMKQTLETNEKTIPGGTHFTLKFEMTTNNETYRNNVVDMIHQAVAGATIVGETDQKPSALGFHKDEDEE
jgi:hypothetical protein